MKILLVIACFLLGSCTAGLGGAKITDFSPDTPVDTLRVRGILEDISNCEQDASGTCTFNVFYTHGMGKTEKDYFKALFTGAAKAGIDLTRIESQEDEAPILLTQEYNGLQLRGEAVSSKTSFCRTQDKVNPTQDKVICQFGTIFKNVYRGEVSGKTVSINSYALFWQDNAWDRVQNSYIGDDLELVKTDSVRLNRILKTFVLDNGFSDAALYLGNFGKVLRASTEGALCMMMRDALGVAALKEQSGTVCDLANFSDPSSIADIESLKVTLVSKSLGSRILLDSLMPLNELNATHEYGQALRVTDPSIKLKDILKKVEEKQFEQIQRMRTKRAFARSLSNSYMLANQFPLLGLGTLSAETGKSMEIRDSIYCQFITHDTLPSDLNQSDWNQSDCVASDTQDGPLALADTPLIVDGVLASDLRLDDRATLNLLPARPVTALDFINESKSAPDAITKKKGATESSNTDKKAPSKLNIYAFRDPNDALGYKATAHTRGKDKPGAYENINVFEIQHRNAREYVFLFAWPEAAHAKEDDRNQSLALIWCGGVADENGVLDEKRCH